MQVTMMWVTAAAAVAVSAVKVTAAEAESLPSDRRSPSHRTLL